MSYAEEILLTQEMVRIESSNPGSYEGALSDFVYNWFKTNTDAEVIREPVHEGRDNIIARIKGASSEHNLTYICHMDTVPLGEGWNTDPLDPVIVDGKMYGRGACDMKSGLAAGMIAFRNIAALKAPLKYDFQFIATVNEEDTMTGAEQVIKDGYVDANSWVLDAEPTDNRIQVAHKGKTWFIINTHGTAWHASTPEKGVSAIAAMAEIITRINHKLTLLPTHKEMGACAATFGSIHGGLNTNIVPAECTATIDMRLVPPTTNEQSIALVDEAIAEALEAVPGATCDYVITAARPATDKDDNSFLLGKLKEACVKVTGHEIPVDFFPGYTDTAVIAGTVGNFNCMSFGPGSLDVCHKPNEYVPCDEITRSVNVMTELAKDILL